MRGEREALLKNAKITHDLQHYQENRVDAGDNLEEMSYLCVNDGLSLFT